MTDQPPITAETKTARASDRELVLTRLYDAEPSVLFRAWTDPVLLEQWFAPRPYTTAVAGMDVRPGGASLIVMKGPDGGEIPCPGVFLEVVENRRLVMTDAYTAAWTPSEKPFMTTIVTFEPAAGGRTAYTARVLHWSAEDREAHENMGFHEGWGQVAEQLAEVVARL